MKKRLITYITALTLVIMLSGCASLPHIWGNSSASISNQQSKIVQVNNSISANKTKKLNTIGQLSLGVSLSLNNITNVTPQVNTAETLNARIMALANKPSLIQAKAVTKMVSNLIRQNEQGKAELKKLDSNINAIQEEENILVTTKNKQIKNLISLSNKIARKSDANAQTLNQMNSYFGLGAVFYGLKRLFLHLLWLAIGFVVIFIILRLLAGSNPIAAVFFSIFQSFGAMTIHIIESLVPNSINTLNNLKNGTNKLVNSISDETKETK